MHHQNSTIDDVLLSSLLTLSKFNKFTWWFTLASTENVRRAFSWLWKFYSCEDQFYFIKSILTWHDWNVHKKCYKKYRLIASYRQCSFTRTYFRCRRLDMSYKKAALKYFVRFTGKHLSSSLSFNKIADYRQPQYYMTSSIWQ